MAEIVQFEPEISEEEAARRLHMHVETLRKERRANKIGHFKRGRRATYAERHLVEYQKSREVLSKGDAFDRERIIAEYAKIKLGAADWPHKPGTIYIARCGDAVKIGFTAGDAAKRLRALQTGNPTPVSLLAAVAGTYALEKALHVHLAKYHVGGEWFRICPEIEAWLRYLPEATETVG